jgi:DNA-binding transcriptional LysR family regulator
VRAILEEPLGARYDALDVRLELASDALMRCVEEGMGITFLPERVAEKWVRSEPIATVGIADLDLTRELAFVVAESRARSNALVTFDAWLTANYTNRRAIRRRRSVTAIG